MNNKFTYIPKNKSVDENNKNQVKKYTNSLIKSDIDKVNADLQYDIQKNLNNGCTYLPNFFCKTEDKTIFNKLKNELDNQTSQMVKWSQHFKYENPDFSPTFNSIVKSMAEYFKVEVYQTRLNYYKDGIDWKPFHHDSHAYSDGTNKIIEDFTMGASFGDSRELEFMHESSGAKFKFPQNNGDIFAFNAEVNKKFMHGVPKVFKLKNSRFSIIAWGKKK